MAPVFLSLSTPAASRDVVHHATNGYIVALDVHGSQLWSHQNGPGGCRSTTTHRPATPRHHPIDPNRLFVYGYGLDGYVHKYQVGSGTGGPADGWPTATVRDSREVGLGIRSPLSTGPYPIS
jgi:hypothetical protein